MPHKSERIVETAVAARGGFLGRPVLTVLIVSTVVAIVAMAVAYVRSLQRSDLCQLSNRRLMNLQAQAFD